nr:probable carboxylesterase 18 [Tanacetum cinerariifolium]
MQGNVAFQCGKYNGNVAFQCGKLFRRDGTPNRHLLKPLQRRVPPISEPNNGVKTYDVDMDPTSKLWFRVFVPTEEGAVEDLPIVVFFHGGGFVYLSANANIYDVLCRRFARSVPAIVVSLDYRLAPEHQYPVQHNDCFDMLKYLDDDENRSKWLPDNANISRCFLVGDSAGGNIAHHVAQRACEFKFNRLKPSAGGINAFQYQSHCFNDTKGALSSSFSESVRSSPPKSG